MLTFLYASSKGFYPLSSAPTLALSRWERVEEALKLVRCSPVHP
jgi:hypothetical protein